MKTDDLFTETIQVKCPPRLRALIDQAATRECVKPSEYVRRSIIKELKADGVFAAEIAA